MYGVVVILGMGRFEGERGVKKYVVGMGIIGGLIWMMD